MTATAIMKKIWALPADERAKIRAELEKKNADDKFYEKEGVTREELLRRAEQSDIDFAAGRYKTLDEVFAKYGL